MGYTQDALKGISWFGLLRAVTRVISFFRTAILARLLDPAQFGIFGIASIVLSFIEVITETGINIFLIQRKENIDKYINTAWVVSILRGFIISVIILVSAPYVAGFFQAPDAAIAIYLISIVPIFRGFINPSIAKFHKDLEFRKEFGYRTTIFFIESLVSVVGALILGSSVAIVIGLIVGALCEVILSHAVITPRPRFVYEKTYFVEIISRGKWLTMAGIMGYTYQNLDNIVVGRLLGTSSLGLYDVAYRISMIPITEVAEVIGNVSFPVFVRISEDRKRLKRAFIRTLLAVLVIVIPIGILIMLFPELIISVLLGDQWVGATEALQILAILGIARAVTTIVRAPIYALEKQHMVTVITLVSLVGIGITIIPFVVRWGIVGAAYAALAGTLLSLIPIMYYLRKIFSQK